VPLSEKVRKISISSFSHRYKSFGRLGHQTVYKVKLCKKEEGIIQVLFYDESTTSIYITKNYARKYYIFMHVKNKYSSK